MENVKIACPHCGFYREIEQNKVPEGQTRVTCPQCKQVFDFTKEEKGFTFQSAEGEQAGRSDAAAILKYSGFWVRFAAYLIDNLVWLAILFILLKLVLPPGGARELFLSVHEGELDYLLNLTGVIVVFLTVGLSSVIYYIICWNKWGRTLGMKTVGIKVIDYNGENLKASNAFLRWLTGYLLPGIIPYLSFFAYIALGIMVGVNKKKQGWHDMAAKSYVVYE